MSNQTKHKQNEPPPPPLDIEGKMLEVGNYARIESVASCITDLPSEDQARLSGLIGQVRPLLEIDRFGFVWFSFVKAERTRDFCLFPNEVSLVADHKIEANPT